MADETDKSIEGFGALTDQARKQAAYNALAKSYGPAIAYDPTNAFNASKASVQQQEAPTQVQQSQANLQGTNLENTGKQLANTDTAQTQQRMAAYRGAQMLLSQADPQTGAIPQDAYDRIVKPNAALFGIDPEHVEPFGQMLTQPGGANYVQHVAQALIGPTKVTGAVSYGLDANGNPVAITKDQYGNIHQQPLGGTVTTQQQNATTGAKKVPISQENADTNRAKLPILQQNADANTYGKNTTSNNSLFGNPAGALPSRGGGAPAPAAPAAAPGNAPAAAPAIDPNSQFAKLPPKGRNLAIDQADGIVNAGSQLVSTNKILDGLTKQISPYTAGTGSLLKSLPGSAQADLKANLKTLAASGLMAFIQSVKAGGPGGTGGLRLASEANAAMALFGNMEQDQSAKQLAFHAQLFRQTVNNLYQHQQQAFHAKYGVLPHQAVGTNDPMAPKAAAPADSALSAAYAKYGIK